MNDDVFEEVTAFAAGEWSYRVQVPPVDYPATAGRYWGSLSGEDREKWRSVMRSAFSLLRGAANESDLPLEAKGRLLEWLSPPTPGLERTRAADAAAPFAPDDDAAKLSRQERRGLREDALAQRDPKVIVAEYLAAIPAGQRGINLGCGGMTFKGWLNIDQDYPWHLDIQCDLTKGLPFLPGNVFDAVYSEHFFEHIPRKAAIDLLTDCHRALRPGGHVRIAMPDLRKFAQTYLGAGRHPEVNDAIKAEFGEVSGTNCELLNFGMRESGHSWIYDQEELDWLLRRVGFVDVGACCVRRSSVPLLDNRESRSAVQSALIAEARKPD